jgi:hypothetical protein
MGQKMLLNLAIIVGAVEVLLGAALSLGFARDALQKIVL